MGTCTNDTRRTASISRRRRKGVPLRTGRRDWLWAVAFIVIVGIFVIPAVMFVIASSGTKANEPPIAGIDCESEQTTYHVHPQLLIYVEGQLVTIPNNVGIVDHECYYWLHTHDASTGTIHVEAPREGNYTLRQFFAIWKQTGSSAPPPIFDQTPDGTHSVRATVNGQPWTGDPGDIPLTDKSVIIVEYGPPFKA
jgi:hypothetical protein